MSKIKRNEMAYAKCEVTISQPISDIYEFILEGENNRFWRPEILDISKSKESSSTGENTIYIQGIRGPNNTRISADYRITKCIKDRLMAFEVLTGPYRAEGLFELTSAGKETKVVFSMTERHSDDETRSTNHLQKVVNALIGLKTYYEKINVPNMLLIGSTGRNSGKTSLAKSFINKWQSKHKVIGLKVTTIHEEDGGCPRGSNGCGVCSSLKENYRITEEKKKDLEKDTSQLLAAGADQVFWLKTKKSYIEEGIREFLSGCGDDVLIICESNSLRQVVRPGYFIMMKSSDTEYKASAEQVMRYCDALLDYRLKDDHKVLDSLEIHQVNTQLYIEKIKEGY